LSIPDLATGEQQAQVAASEMLQQQEEEQQVHWWTIFDQWGLRPLSRRLPTVLQPS
jgi:hypothetical protein